MGGQRREKAAWFSITTAIHGLLFKFLAVRANLQKPQDESETIHVYSDLVYDHQLPRAYLGFLATENCLGIEMQAHEGRLWTQRSNWFMDGKIYSRKPWLVDANNHGEPSLTKISQSTCHHWPRLVRSVITGHCRLIMTTPTTLAIINRHYWLPIYLACFRPKITHISWTLGILWIGLGKKRMVCIGQNMQKLPTHR